MKSNLHTVERMQPFSSALLQATFSGFAILLVLVALVFTCPACKDECPLTCKNGATQLNDCSCKCTDGFEGADCSDQTTPDYITVKTVRLTKYPVLKSNGQSFDPNNQVDPWIVIRRENATSHVLRTDAKLNILPNSVVELPFTGTGKITDVQDGFTLFLNDCDNSGDCYDVFEEMGKFDFDLYTKTNGFPAKLTLTSPDGAIVVELEVDYTYP